MAEESKLKDYAEILMWLAIFGTIMYFGLDIFGKIQKKIKERVAKEIEEIK